MATPVLVPAFTTGEVTPGLFGRQDVAKLHSGASTMRNMYVGYRGGAYSRPGTRFVTFSKQIGRPFPPRLIPFQFNINQGLILEFGNFYMRVILNGAAVTEAPIPISAVTQANPGVVTAGGSSGQFYTPDNSAVVASYSVGDQLTLVGGIFVSPAIVLVTDTILLSCAPNARGSGYVPGNTITLAGGTYVTPPVLTLVTTQVVSASIAAAGTGGTPGTATVTGTTGAGTKFQASVTIGGGGAIASVDSITLAGSYTTNPTVLANEPVTGGGLTGAQLNIAMGVGSFFVSVGGDCTLEPPGNVFTQASSSGPGTGATFQSGIFGPLIVSPVSGGAYTALPVNPVSTVSNGDGLGARFNVTWNATSTNGLVTGDWVFITGVQGMTELNGQTFVAHVISPTTFSLFDVFGNPVDTTVFPAYTGGGTIARIFTLPTIYSDADLEYLKFVQSADVMTICCVNQITNVEYPPQDLSRFSDTFWVFTPVVPAPTIQPPSGTSGINVFAGGYTGPVFPGEFGTNYAYCVTAVSNKDQTESIASGTAFIINGCDISATAGSNIISWNPVQGAQSYNIYKTEPTYFSTLPPPPGETPPPVGSLFGYVGSAFGVQFSDANTTADFQQVPPLRKNPFGRGQIIDVVIDNQGSGYGFFAGVSIIGSTGDFAILEALVQNGQVVAVLILDAGQNYLPTDQVVISGTGSGATAHLVIGPQTGTYPGVPSYFQQRRVFGNTLNNPDTYYMSQPGAFTNFDSRIPTIASDAITGTPWSLQVNGIQWFVLMPAGLLTMTGVSAWLLVGSGSFATNVQPISPENQVAQPLAFSGTSATVPPIKINYDILYVGSKGSYYFDLPYQLYALSEPIDLTIFSSHLFDDFTVREHAWAETPYKLIWSVRNDGSLLSLTYLKQQQVAGWARHDTKGHFWSVASIVEPVIATPELGVIPAEKTDAVYVAVERPELALAAQFVPPPPPPAEKAQSVILVGVHLADILHFGAVTSLTSPNLTFSRKAITSSTDQGAGVNYKQSWEIWWAPLPLNTVLTNEVITVVASIAPTAGTLLIAECKGGAFDFADPWDNNASLPAINHEGPGNVPAFVDNVSTSYNSSPVLWLISADLAVSLGPIGWTQFAIANDIGFDDNSEQRFWWNTLPMQNAQTITGQGNSFNWGVISLGFKPVPFVTGNVTGGTANQVSATFKTGSTPINTCSATITLGL